jgi:hypothetical protein
MKSKSDLKFKVKKVISISDWDELVKKTYGKPYSFQQQDGCKGRGTEVLIVPVPKEFVYDYEAQEIPEIVNGEIMGVSFVAWLARDPSQALNGEKILTKESWEIEMWWDRNFYPHISMIANDLYNKGLLESGEYVIDIDW